MRTCFSLLILLWSSLLQADVVKPALAEISVYEDGRVDIELRASIEALITGISTQYKNTKEAPQADEYDALRVLDSAQLHKAFNSFAPDMLATIKLTVDGKALALRMGDAHIPSAGYTQVPRISTIHLLAQLPANAASLQFYYPARYGDYAVRVRQVNEAEQQWHWSQYTDHILFILGVFLFSRQWRPLLGQVTMFTLAHTLTLGLSTAGLFALSPRIVEPLIALSIAYVGFENIRCRELGWKRLALVFAFGLLHGLGFAGVLADFHMPENAFFTALFSFNIGVELGQIAVLLAAALLVGWIKPEERYRRYVAIPVSLLITVIGLYWMVERLQL